MFRALLFDLSKNLRLAGPNPSAFGCQEDLHVPLMLPLLVTRTYGVLHLALSTISKCLYWIIVTYDCSPLNWSDLAMVHGNCRQCHSSRVDFFRFVCMMIGIITAFCIHLDIAIRVLFSVIYLSISNLNLIIGKRTRPNYAWYAPLVRMRVCRAMKYGIVSNLWKRFVMSKNCDFIFAEIFQVLSLYNDIKNGLRRVLKISSEYIKSLL